MHSAARCGTLIVPRLAFGVWRLAFRSQGYVGQVGAHNVLGGCRVDLQRYTNQWPRNDPPWSA
jgi:hypothetical protein